MTGITILLVALALMVPWIWRNPANGLLALAALTPLNGLRVLFPGVLPAFWKEALLAATLIIAVVAARGRPTTRLSVPWWPAIAALLVFGVVSGVAVYGIDAAVPLKITYFYLVIVLVLWFAPFTATDRDRLVTVIMVVGVINGAVGIIQQIVGADFLVDLGYKFGNEVRTSGPLLRSFGTFNQPFPFGFFLMMAILIGLAVALADPHRRRNKVFLWCLPMLVAGLALSVVRASYVGLVVGLIVIGIVRYRSILAALAATAVVAVPIVLFLLPRSVISSVASADSYQTRAAGWGVIWRSIADHPLGQGLGATGSAAQKLAAGQLRMPDNLLARIDGATQLAFGLPYQPDNYYVKLLIEVGPIGLWLFLMFLVCAFIQACWTSRRAATPVDGALAAGIAGTLAAAAAASFFSTYYEIFPIDVYTWLLVGALGTITVSVVDPPRWSSTDIVDVPSDISGARPDTSHDQAAR